MNSDPHESPFWAHALETYKSLPAEKQEAWLKTLPRDIAANVVRLAENN